MREKKLSVTILTYFISLQRGGDHIEEAGGGEGGDVPGPSQTPGQFHLVDCTSAYTVCSGSRDPFYVVS